VCVECVVCVCVCVGTVDTMSNALWIEVMSVQQERERALPSQNCALVHPKFIHKQAWDQTKRYKSKRLALERAATCNPS